MDPEIDQLAEPFFAYEVKVCFADTRCNTDDQFVFHTILNALEGLVENVFSTPALIADQVGSFDADQRGGIADLSQPSCDFVRNQLPVGEDLEVAVAVGFENIEKVRMHEGFATEDTEVTVAVGFGVSNQSVQVIFADHLSRRSDIDPAALATELATVDDGDEQEWWEVDSLFESLLELLNGTHSFVSEVVSELPKESFIDRCDHPVC